MRLGIEDPFIEGKDVVRREDQIKILQRLG
jgi:hypothetical protein